MNADECWLTEDCVAGYQHEGDCRLARRTPDALIANLLALHRRRPHEPFDFITFGQTEFPDLCDHCRRRWPCETAAIIEARA